MTPKTTVIATFATGSGEAKLSLDLAGITVPPALSDDEANLSLVEQLTPRSQRCSRRPGPLTRREA